MFLINSIILLILSIFIVNINGKCLKVTTTTIPSTQSQCVPILQFTNSFGDSKLKGTLNKKVDLIGLSSITVYSGNYVDAIQFNYNNGIIDFMGAGSSPDTTSVVDVDLNNKIISGVRLQYSDAINNIQFEIYDLKSNERTWTQQFGGSGGLSTKLDFGNEIALNSLYSLSNANYIQFLIFGYYSFNCSQLDSINYQILPSTSIINQCGTYGGSIILGDSSNNYTIPLSTTLPPTTFLTTTTTATVVITTTNANVAFIRIVIGKNRTHDNSSSNIEANLILNNNQNLLADDQYQGLQPTTTIFPGEDSFNVLFSEISSITVHSGSFINALEFQHLDGSIEIHGNVNNTDTTSVKTIYLNNLVVTSMNIRADWAIRGLQFQLYDPLTNNYSMSDEFGSKIGNLFNINTQYIRADLNRSGYVGSVEILNIYHLSGSYRTNYPVKLSVGFYYIFCQN